MRNEGGGRVVVPYSGRSLTRSEDAFTHFRSSCRVSVEKSFGMLTNTFGILWSLVRYSVSTSASIVVACCRLHNFLLSREIVYSCAADVENNVRGAPRV